MEINSQTIICPCKRKKCERFGDCTACKEHHAERKTPAACERLEAKKEHENKRKYGSICEE